ncbi:MAG: hypothetical protein NUV65_04815 [Candidatus Roizmanbacteria bacterium]|nr:hypothetical protein [Candidatus Roizmanbacteria bacterium]
MITTQCPDCKGLLEEGAILDFTYGSVMVERYAKTQIPTNKKGIQGMKWVHEGQFNDLRRVISKRCMSCNRIFHYAQDEILIQNLNANTNKTMLIITTILFVVMIVGFIISMASW